MFKRSIRIIMAAAMVQLCACRSPAQLTDEEFARFTEEIRENDNTPHQEEVRESIAEWADENTPALLELVAEDPRFETEDFNEFREEYKEGDLAKEEVREIVEVVVEKRLPFGASATGSSEAPESHDDREQPGDESSPWRLAFATLMMFVAGLLVGCMWLHVRRSPRY